MSLLLLWGRRLGGLSALGLLSACGFFGSKPSSELAFPVARAALPNVTDSVSGGLMPGGQAAAELVTVNPFDPIALNNMAVLEASRGRYVQALSLLQRAVKLAPARPDIANNLNSLQRWMAQAQGQASLGLTPQPLQLPYQETGVPEIPPLWLPPGSGALPGRTVGAPVVPGGSPPLAAPELSRMAR